MCVCVSPQDLELELKNACDRFIAHGTQIVARPLVQFVHAIEAFQRSNAGVPLSEQPFASVDRMRAMADELRETLQGNLGPLRATLGLYLGSPVTQSILFKPIKVPPPV